MIFIFHSFFPSMDKSTLASRSFSGLFPLSSSFDLDSFLSRARIRSSSSSILHLPTILPSCLFSVRPFRSQISITQLISSHLIPQFQLCRLSSLITFCHLSFSLYPLTLPKVSNISNFRIIHFSGKSLLCEMIEGKWWQARRRKSCRDASSFDSFQLQL